MKCVFRASGVADINRKNGVLYSLVPKLQRERRPPAKLQLRPPDAPGPMRSRYTIKKQASHTSSPARWSNGFPSSPGSPILTCSSTPSGFCRQHKGLKVYAYIILDNLLHLMVSGDRLTDIIRDFKSYTAKGY